MNPVFSYRPPGIASAAVVLLAISAAICLPAHAANDPIGCGAVVVSDLTLKGDVGPCPGDGLTVVSDGITVNLNGYKVYASRRQNVGIRLEHVSNVVVKGGVTDGFDSGVLLVGGWNNTVTGVAARNNRIGIHVTNAPAGAHTVEKNKVVANRLFGIFSSNMSRLSIKKNIVIDNVGYGVVFDGESSYSSIENNEIRQNPSGDIELRENEEWFSYQNLISPLFALSHGPSGARRHRPRGRSERARQPDGGGYLLERLYDRRVWSSRTQVW